MNVPLQPDRFRFVPGWIRWVGLSALSMGLGAALCYGAMRSADPGAPTPNPANGDKTTAAVRDKAIVRMGESKWPAAGIRIEPAVSSAFTERVWRTGRLALNETRVAHLSPMVEGLVSEVKARLGQEVQAGEVLAILDSREVGQAKLELVKARLAVASARVQHAWTQATNEAANELVQVMAGDAPVSEIEKRFKDRSIGELRQQLVTAYSRRLQAKAQFDGVSRAGAEGSVPEATVTRLRADVEAAEATFRALCEEVRFQTGQQNRLSEQKLRDAQTAEALGQATLMMFGYSRAEIGAMDPLAEGPMVSRYAIRAPFAGTVIDMHAVLADRVGPGKMMFQIADLSTLWLQADVPQKDLPLVQGLTGCKLRMRLSEESEDLQEAVVFYTGDVLDRNTRTATMSALALNPKRLLKPGMFVEVELARPGAAVVQVPAEAIQRQGSQAFVFVHLGGEEFRVVNVKLGRASEGVVEVLEGVSAGQRIVVAGGFVLKSEWLKDQIAGD